MAIGPISITAQRAQLVQFSQPYYQSSLGILAPAADSLLSKIRPFLTKTFLAGTSGLMLVLLGVGSLVWLLERKHNPEQFPAHPLKGIGNGVWLALVTMTTVGYGDRVPLSAAGRVVCGVWMLVSMIVASSLTAFMATALTLSQLDGPRLSEASDMKSRPVAVVAGSTSESFARTHRARLQPQDTLEDAIGLVQDGSSDAVVADRPMLQHWISNNAASDLQLSEASYLPHGYGFAISHDAVELRSELDLALLRLIAQGRMSQLSAQWLGAP